MEVSRTYLAVFQDQGLFASQILSALDHESREEVIQVAGEILLKIISGLSSVEELATQN
jgi:hypothetical protein